MLGGVGEGFVASLLVSGYRKLFPGRWKAHGTTVKFFAVALAAAICAAVPGLLGGVAAMTILKTAGTAFITAVTARQVVKKGGTMAAEVRTLPRALVEKISIRTKPPSR